MDSISLKDKVSEGLRAFQESRWQDAILLLKDSYTASPSNVDIASKLGFAFSQAKDYKQAIAIFEDLSSSQPEREVWPYSVGYQHYIQSYWGPAIEWFDKALSLNPNYIKALYRKGYAQLHFGKREEAIEVLQHCIRTWEKSSHDNQRLERKNYAKANFALGKAYLSVGLSLKARRPLEKAVEFDSEDADKRYELGKCQLINGNADVAIEQLKKANSLKPGLYYVLDRLAQAQIAKNDFNNAEETYKLIPEYCRRPYILKNMGELYLKLEQPEKAEAILRQALKKDHNSHTIYYALGKALESLGRKREARQAYSKALGLREKNYGQDIPDARTRIEQLEAEIANIEPVPDSTLSTTHEQGIIEYYNTQKGYGFIMSDLGKKVFFHISTVVENIIPSEGARVIVQYEDSPKGLKSNRVEILST